MPKRSRENIMDPAVQKRIRNAWLTWRQSPSGLQFRREISRPGGPRYQMAARGLGRPAYSDERKHWDTVCQGGVLSSAATWGPDIPLNHQIDPAGNVNAANEYALNCPSQGTLSYQRVGSKMRVSKIVIRGFIEIDQQDLSFFTDNAPLVRILVVCDKDPQGAGVNMSQVMAVSPSAFQCMNSFQHIEYFGRYRVLWDKLIKVQAPPILYNTTSSTIQQGGFSIPFKKTIRFKTPLPITFIPTVTSGGFGSVARNLIALGAHASNADLAATIHYWSRCYYYG